MTTIPLRTCHSEPGAPFVRDRQSAHGWGIAAVQLALLLLIFVSAKSALGQSDPTGLYRIAGTVVSSADGHLLQNASVTIRQQDPAASSKPIIRTITSDEDGRFQFTDLPAGNFTLLGESHNFLLTYYDDHDGFTTGIITGSTVATDALVLKLIPKSSLSGTIRNDAGEPVANASVRLFRQSHSFGDDRIAPAGTQQTDDLGHFDFASLAPADYLVAVTAQPWYAVHPQPDRAANPAPMVPANMPADQLDATRRMFTQMQRQQVFGVSGPLDSSLDVAYPVTYYPGGTDSSEAQPIPLRPGDSREISLQLNAVPAVTITITEPNPINLNLPQNTPTNPEEGALLSATLQNQARLRQQQIPQLRTSIFGNLERVPMQQINSPAGTMLTGIPAGDYLVAGGDIPINQSLGTTPIHLSPSDHSLAATTPDISALAHLHVKIESPGPATTPSVRIGLARAGSNDLVIRSVAAKNDTVIDVPPGDYSFTVQPENITATANARNVRTWFLRSVSADGKPLAANSIHVAAGDSPAVTLTIVAGTHTVRGVVIHSASSTTDLSPQAERAAPADRAVDGPAPTNSDLSSRAEPRSGAVDGPAVASERNHTQPAPGTFLLLIPTADLKAGHRRFWRQQSDLDGSFTIAGLAPGSYTLFAIDDGWNLSWQQTGALDRYLPAAAQITIPQNAPPTFTLPHPIPAQPK
jgi:hypothetical protein